MARVETNGIHLEVVDDVVGEPLVLLMGLGTQLIFWPDEFLDRLRRDDVRVVRCDNRDSGLSWRGPASPPRGILPAAGRALLGRPATAPYTLRDMAADVAGVIDALGLGSAHVGGISMGAMIAQQLAIDAPGRVRSLISIASTPSPRIVGRPKAFLGLLKRTPRNREGAIDHLTNTLRLLAGGASGFDEARVRDLGARAYDRGHHPSGVARQLLAVLASGSRRRALRQVRCPALVIHGALDPLFPRSAARATAAAIPGARLEIVDDMGHGLHGGGAEHVAGLIAEFVNGPGRESRRHAPSLA